MRNIRIMTIATLREALSKKVFIFFLGISTLVMIIQAVILSFFNTTQLMNPAAFPGSTSILETAVGKLELMIISPLSTLCLLLSVFTCSSFIPSMLEKGNIDLLLSKPVSRTELLIGKYLGGLLVVFINIFYTIFGVWLILSIKFGYWDPTFLSAVFIITFTFAILYSIIVLLGVITQGSTSGMMAAYFIFILVSPLLYLGKTQFQTFIESSFWKNVLKGLYYIFPKTHELMGETLNNLATKKGIADFQPVITSFVFLILLLLLSIFIFRKKDF